MPVDNVNTLYAVARSHLRCPKNGTENRRQIYRTASGANVNYRHLPRTPCDKFMPSSHLPRTPCDKFVYDFSCDFGGIVGGYGLRHMCSHWLRASCYFFYWVSPYRDCAEIVCQCSCRPVSARKSYGARAGIGLRAVPVRGLCNATCDMPTGYGLTISPNLSNFSLNQIVEDAEPVNPYENLTAAASCLRREASRGPHWKGDTGRIRAPYTHRKPNVN